MGRLVRWVSFGFAGLVVLGMLMPEKPLPARDSDVSRDAPLALKSREVLALPGDPAKDGLLDTLPKPASLAVPSAVEPRVVAPDYVYVTGSRVNLRAGAGVSNKRIGAFDRGTRLIRLEQAGGWSKVSGSKAGTPLSGWMSSDYLSSEQPIRVAVPAPKPKRTVAAPSTADIRAAQDTLISQSLAAYPGNCPCPYNRDRAGRRCGGRSAWSRPGGRAPLCYDSDVSRSHLAAYFRRIGKSYP